MSSIDAGSTPFDENNHSIANLSAVRTVPISCCIHSKMLLRGHAGSYPKTDERGYGFKSHREIGTY